MNSREEQTMRREVGSRCRHSECIAARADELAAAGLLEFAVQVRGGDLPVRCKREKKSDEGDGGDGGEGGGGGDS